MYTGSLYKVRRRKRTRPLGVSPLTPLYRYVDIERRHQKLDLPFQLIINNFF